MSEAFLHNMVIGHNITPRDDDKPRAQAAPAELALGIVVHRKSVRKTLRTSRSHNQRGWGRAKCVASCAVAPY